MHLLSLLFSYLISSISIAAVAAAAAAASAVSSSYDATAAAVLPSIARICGWDVTSEIASYSCFYSVGTASV